jgi:hypothetical protein
MIPGVGRYSMLITPEAGRSSTLFSNDVVAAAEALAAACHRVPVTAIRPPVTEALT